MIQTREWIVIITRKAENFSIYRSIPERSEWATNLSLLAAAGMPYLADSEIAGCVTKCLSGLTMAVVLAKATRFLNGVRKSATLRYQKLSLFGKVSLAVESRSGRS